jgi:hypothetical protein
MLNIKAVKFIGVAAAAALIGTALVYSTSDAEGSQTTPGSADDPIVTKSYVDQKVAELVQQKLNDLGQTGGSASAKLEVVDVPWGKKLLVEDGGELIVRAGKAIAYSTDANGLSDMTAGLDIAPGSPVEKNHLILFPRGGRGVEPDPKQQKGLTVLVRGGYQLE